MSLDQRTRWADAAHGDIGHGSGDRNCREALVVAGLVIAQRMLAHQNVVAGRARRPRECDVCRRPGDEAGYSLRAHGHVISRVFQDNIKTGHVLVTEVLHRHRNSGGGVHHCGRSGHARDGQICERTRRWWRKPVDRDAETVEHEIDAVGDRHRRVAGEEQRDGIEISVISHDERARIPAAAECARRDDELVHVSGGLHTAEP